MGYGQASFSKRLTSPYDRDEPSLDWPLPDGFPGITDVDEGETDDTATLELAMNKLTLTLDPSDSTFSLDRNELTGITGSVTGFNSWTIKEKHPQRVTVSLGGGSTVECYSIGLIVFRDADVSIDDSGDVGDAAHWPFHEEVADDWWMASDEPISISGEAVDHGGSFGLFYHRIGGEAYWAMVTTSEVVQDRLVPSTNNSRLYQAIRAATWLKYERDMKEIERDAYITTSTRKALDRWGHIFNVSRGKDQIDEDYRFDIITEAKIRYGGDTEDDITDFVERLIQAPSNSVTIINRNTDPDTGKFSPARFQVSFDFNLLEELGFSQDEFSSVIARIDEMLLRVTAAGVFADVAPTGGATWGTDTYGDDAYGV